MASLDASSGCALQLPTVFYDFLMISQQMVLAMTESMGTVSAETEPVPPQSTSFQLTTSGKEHSKATSKTDQMNVLSFG